MSHTLWQTQNTECQLFLLINKWWGNLAWFQEIVIWGSTLQPDHEGAEKNELWILSAAFKSVSWVKCVDSWVVQRVYEGKRKYSYCLLHQNHGLASPRTGLITVPLYKKRTSGNEQSMKWSSWKMISHQGTNRPNKYSLFPNGTMFSLTLSWPLPVRNHGTGVGLLRDLSKETKNKIILHYGNTWVAFSYNFLKLQDFCHGRNTY